MTKGRHLRVLPMVPVGRYKGKWGVVPFDGNEKTGRARSVHDSEQEAEIAMGFDPWPYKNMEAKIKAGGTANDKTYG